MTTACWLRPCSCAMRQLTPHTMQARPSGRATHDCTHHHHFNTPHAVMHHDSAHPHTPPGHRQAAARPAVPWLHHHPPAALVLHPAPLLLHPAALTWQVRLVVLCQAARAAAAAQHSAAVACTGGGRCVSSCGRPGHVSRVRLGAVVCCAAWRAACRACALRSTILHHHRMRITRHTSIQARCTHSAQGSTVGCAHEPSSQLMCIITTGVQLRILHSLSTPSPACAT